MKKLLIAIVIGMPLGACTENTVITKPPPAAAPADADPAESMDGTEPPVAAMMDSGTTPAPTSSSKAPEDRCLDGQDMNADDVDVSKCPAIPSIPADAPMGKETMNLGAWEMGTTVNGDNYVYGTLSSPTSNPRVLSFDGGTAAVNAENLSCWAKGYYRLRKILQDPPAEYVALYNAHFQYRFFQFQSDLRNGPTGFKEITSFEDHLVKWVTVITAQGVCQQPTLGKFKAYASAELKRRGIAAPK